MENNIKQAHQEFKWMDKRIILEVEPNETPEKDPQQKPEVEPDALPEENPGIQPGTQPGKHDDDDDDDDPFTETEIGDDPDEIGKKTTIM